MESKEKARANSRAYYQANKERIINRMINYYNNNRMDRLAYQTKYNEKNCDDIAAYQKEYCKAHKSPTLPPKEPSEKAVVVKEAKKEKKPKNTSYKPRIRADPIKIIEGPIWVVF